jgi:hypothetical protein
MAQTKLDQIIEDLVRERGAPPRGATDDRTGDDEAARFLEAARDIAGGIHGGHVPIGPALLAGAARTRAAPDEATLRLVAALNAGDDAEVTRLLREGGGGPRPRAVWGRGWAAVAAAAALLLGCFAAVRYNQATGRIPGGREVLLADLTPAPRPVMGADSEVITLDSRGTYRVPPGRGFDVTIRSLRGGWATVVVLAPGGAQVYPQSGQAPIRIEPNRPRNYGPLTSPDGRSAVVTVVSAADATAVVRDALAAGDAAPERVDQLLERLQEALWRAGHRWVAIGRVTVEPGPGRDRPGGDVPLASPGGAAAALPAAAVEPGAHESPSPAGTSVKPPRP